MVDWAHAGPSMLAAFLASLVEFVEALTVVLAVGTVRGWWPALAGTGAALALLLLMISVLGPALARIPLVWVQLAVGALLLLFGMRWLRKAILRAAGVVPLHDEAASFASETEALGRRGAALSAGWDAVALATAFKIVMLEGIEVVFIVLAIGAMGDLLVPASAGAAAALLVVVMLGLVLHRPLTRIPENMLKLVVGVLLSAFGTFWVGEGLGFAWPGEDWFMLGLAAGFLILALLVAPVCRARYQAPPAAPAVTGGGPAMNGLRAVLRKLVALFVDDGSLALGILAWLMVSGLILPHVPAAESWRGILLFLGLAAVLAENVIRAARRKRRSPLDRNGGHTA